MITKTVTVSQTYELEYDPESDEFKQALDDYRGSMDSGADENGMLLHIAYSLSNSGSDTNHALIEGVGRVSDNGDMPEDMWCGVNVLDIDTDSDIS